MNRKQYGLLAGSVIGAILGAGTAYLLMTKPDSQQGDAEAEPVSAADLIGLTGSAALVIRKLDDIRRKI